LDAGKKCKQCSSDNIENEWPAKKTRHATKQVKATRRVEVLDDNDNDNNRTNLGNDVGSDKNNEHGRARTDGGKHSTLIPMTLLHILIYFPFSVEFSI